MQMETRRLRYEIKMECDELYRAQVNTWVNLHSAAFRQAYPSRKVNNLYFDTQGLDSYNDHIEGSTERRKLRFRWYGEDLRVVTGQLELKCKRERVGWKMIQPVNASLEFQSCDWADFQQSLILGIRGAPDRLFDELLRVSSPLVINCYKREYFLSADENIRLTLDYEMAAFDQWLSPRPNLTFPIPMINAVVIEFKCDIEHARQLADVLAEFPLRVNRHSKYVTSLDFMMER